VTAFGIQGSGQLVGGAPDPGVFREVAVRAEELGYDSIWAGDHISYRNPILDVVVALSTFAAVTERITVAAGIVLLPLRHPSVVAKEFASLDYASGGRTILGVGVGGESGPDFDAVGVSPRERGARTDDAMRALRALFANRPASYEGHLGLLLDLVPHTGLREVPDPYYGGTDGFERVLDLVEVASAELVRRLQEQLGQS